MRKSDYMQEENKNKADWKSYFQFGEVTNYFTRLFIRKDPDAPSNTNLKVMHGINKISIALFIVALIVMISRAFLR